MIFWCQTATSPRSLVPADWPKQSITPRPPSTGRLSGRHSLPNASRNPSRRPGISAPSESILLTISTRHRLRCFAWSISRRVPYSTPVAASTTTATVSTAARTASAGPRNSGYPGVSMRLTWMRSPFAAVWSIEAMAVSMEWPRCFSIGSKSDTVLPRSIVPAVWSAPPACSRASKSVVLPAAGWPARATLRMALVAYDMSGLLPFQGRKAVMAVRAARRDRRPGQARRRDARRAVMAGDPA